MTSNDNPWIILLGPSPLLIDWIYNQELNALVIDSDKALLELPQTCRFRAVDEREVALQPQTIIDLVPGQPSPQSLLGAIGLTERYLILSAEINEILQSADNTVEAVKRTFDKNRMRQHLATNYHLAVCSRMVANPSELRAFMLQYGLAEAIVKPSNGSGSQGVTLVADSHLDSLDLVYPALAEERLMGPEFSVEIFSANGRHYPLGVTEKITGPVGTPFEFVELGHRFPSTSADKAAVIDAAVGTLDTLGIGEGLTHTEIIMTSRGAKPVETHTRNGGDRIIDLIRLARGIDLMEVALLRRVDGDWRQALEAKHSRFAAISFLLVPEGRITSVNGQSRARFHPNIVDGGINVRAGDDVKAIPSSLGRHGYLIACADTERECFESLRRAGQMLSVDVA